MMILINSPCLMHPNEHTSRTLLMATDVVEFIGIVLKVLKNSERGYVR